MKFSVAVRICEPDAVVPGVVAVVGAEGAEVLRRGVEVEGGGWWYGWRWWGVEEEGVGVGSATVEGRFTRRRSVARGHSIWAHT